MSDLVVWRLDDAPQALEDHPDSTIQPCAKCGKDCVILPGTATKLSQGTWERVLCIECGGGRRQAPPHETVPVPVWVHVDVGIAPLVRRLTALRGVGTFSSCQGTIGEGGPDPYPAYVGVRWDNDEALAALRQYGIVTVSGDHWGYLVP